MDENKNKIKAFLSRFFRAEAITEDDDFFARVASAYERLAAEEPDRIRTLDAGGPPHQVLQAALDELSDLL